MIKSIGLARTQDEYDTTGVYEIVAAMSAKDCPNLSKNDVARWIENKVKPSVREAPKVRKGGRKEPLPDGMHNFHLFDSAGMAYCGRTFRFRTAKFTIQHGFERDPAVVPTVLVQ